MGIASGSLVGLATLSLGWLGFTATQTAPPAQSPSLDKRVTASMTNASMDEVLQWLRRTGVNFVIDKTHAPKDAKLNLNIVDKPLRDVMDAIASAVGGAWQKHGDVYSLRQGTLFGTPTPGFPGEGMEFTLPPMNMDELRSHEAEIAPQIREGLRNFKHEIDPKLLEELEGLKIEMPDFEGFVMPPMANIEMPEAVELLSSLTAASLTRLRTEEELVLVRL